MFRYLVFVFFIAVAERVSAQKDSLAFDEHGKYIYYKTVGASEQNADSLLIRGTRFFKSENIVMVNPEKDNSLTGAGKLTVYNTSLLSHATGEIKYQLRLEVKDFKYRYWLTDFVFTPYYRDRYNNYVRQNGLEVPLEKSSRYLTPKQLDSYLDQLGSLSIALGARLQQRLQKNNTATTLKKVIHIDKW